MTATTYEERGTRRPGKGQAPAPSPAAGSAEKPQTGWRAKVTQTKERLEQYAMFRIVQSVADGFVNDKVTHHAAAMTYYGVFSLFPLILLSLSVAGLAFQNSESAREQIMGVITSLLPQGGSQNQIRDVIVGVIEAKGTAAGVGIVTLLWGVLGWFQVIDTNVNEIWGVSRDRSFIKAKLFALGMVAGIFGVAIVSFGANAAVDLIARFTGGIPGSEFLWHTIISLLSVLSLATAFYVLYRYAPQRKAQFADIWPAALTTAILWEVTRRALAFYLETNEMISGYGPIGAAMALLLWIYVASIIILVGAELSYAIAKEHRHISPQEEMKVIADPGEQPTGKFDYQVGQGADVPQTEDENVPVPKGPPAAGGQKRGAGATGANGAVNGAANGAAGIRDDAPPYAGDPRSNGARGARGDGKNGKAPPVGAADVGALADDRRPRVVDQPVARGVLEAPVAVLSGIGLGFLLSRFRKS